jgi:hypothetical protein
MLTEYKIVAGQGLVCASAYSASLPESGIFVICFAGHRFLTISNIHIFNTK